MVEIKTDGEIQAMRASGRVVAQILATVRGQAAAGTPEAAAISAMLRAPRASRSRVPSRAPRACSS